MTVLVVQHAEVEEPYVIADALLAEGLRIDVLHTHAGAQPPEAVRDLSGLVVMGGPMAADSDDGFPTRSAELALISDALRRRVPVLCVCLGAQLLAVASGGRVWRGKRPEIGWGSVDLTPDAMSDPLLAGLPRRLPVLHWHGDSFDLGGGAVVLASNGNYRNQAFRLGPAAWGLQFHLEVTPTAVQRFVDAFPAEAASVGSEAVLAPTAACLEELEPLRSTVLARFAER